MTESSSAVAAVLDAPPAATQTPLKFTLLETLLKEQQTLSAVDKFARFHGDSHEPHQARYYRELIPATQPQPGQQYAFEVDLDACSGCKACVTACHSLNGLDETETWRSVGLLVGSGEKPVFQMVTSACHHCLHPACMDGCPAMAYDKDPVTGIVKHLDDQCIGCQYCVLKCPYDVPKYSKSRGIVRKCDMCSSRLAVSEAPACVQACPNTAIRITVVDTSDIALRADSALLPDCPASDYTHPSTLYKSKLRLPEAVYAADATQLKPEDSHLPLVATLVLTQASLGLVLAGIVYSATVAQLPPWFAAAVAALAIVGINCAPLHLGRPLYGFRAVLGFRTSWLSREILAFGAYAGALTAYAAAAIVPTVLEIPDDYVAWLRPAQNAAAALSLLTGLGAVFCSAMIYIDTRRPFWSAWLTLPRFFGSVLVASAAALFAMAVTYGRASVIAGICFIAVLVAKLTIEAGFFTHLQSTTLTHHKKSALLMSGPLRAVTIVRFGFGAVAIAAAAAAIIANSPHAALLAGMLAILGEFLERYLFFTAAVRLKMPGALA
ncbi:MAG TPA: DmsC/YnfH family molybdoenzyme membrane anchor subunit [Planctomycetota bacterium]|nr:DmsC/YnfH family molybdoenzyme membrane anchor subunit [Planctomycetota bacterium]